MKDKFWIVLIVNGTCDVLCDVRGEIIRFETQKDADNAAEIKAMEVGEGYQCAVMESVFYRGGFMTTEKILYQSKAN